MKIKGRDAFQRGLAVVVIVAMLAVMGIPVTVIVFFAIVTYFVWRAAQRSDHHQIGRVFEFYLAAHEILNNDERSWFGFEIAEIIERGERAVHSMPDPPPLVHFALGALYHRQGDFEAAAENLAVVVEDELAAERYRVAPSGDLRRYAEVLRKLEREPAEGPLTIKAIRSLERTRRTRAAFLLNDARECLSLVHGPVAAPALGSQKSDHAASRLPSPGPGLSMAAPPSITEVLHDVYEDEKKSA
jgi:hypothetical protein